MRGVIWFQADGNAGHPEEYGELIKALITSWRTSFHAELPFYYVEMNNMWEAQTKPVGTERNMGLIREAQEGAAASEDGRRRRHRSLCGPRQSAFPKQATGG
jgi:sialate O-acetylesterase